MKEIIDKLYLYKEDEYADFIHGLTPTVDRSKFIGVRVPRLRKIAKELSISQCEAFLNELPHYYYEENLLHSFCIERINNYDECIKRINTFLPYIDNWATCDTMLPKCLNKNHHILMTEVKKWLNSDHVYTIRYGIINLMKHYLDNDFIYEYLYLPINLKSNDYYVNIAVAWFYAEALYKQYDSAIKIIEDGILPKWIHNKAIQKACESRRVIDEHKNYLKSLKIF